MVVHDKFGSTFIKKCGVSPDACIQMALQLAYFSCEQKLGLTYESSMTRLFRNGRTETIRSVSTASAKFVKAMKDAQYSQEDRISLLKEAATAHQKYSRDSMCGRAIDRHLFALYVVARGTGRDCKFLSEALSMPWRLSTSQLPQRQTKEGRWPRGTKTDRKYLSPSGGNFH